MAKRELGLALGIVLFLVFIAGSLAITTSLTLKNGTSIEGLVYDRIDGTLAGGKIEGSLSYKDNSIRNPDAYLKICGINSSYLGDKVDLLYSTESGNLTESLLTVNPEITSINQTTNCTTLDIDISAFKALYPARPFVAIFRPVQVNETVNITDPQTNNTTTINITKTIWNRTYLEKMDQSMNGSYILGVDIDPVDSKTIISIQDILDDQGMPITNATKDFLFISIVSGNESIAEARTSPKHAVSFDYLFSGNESVYVNGILSLKVKVIDPCSVVNETGYYYILNDSAWNLNKSCLKVENVSNIVIDFAWNTIDGDLNQTAGPPEVCGVIIENVTNVTIRGVRVQEFGRGICVFNSKNAKIYGDSDQANIKGIYVENSTVKVSMLYLKNKKSEIHSKQNGLVTLDNVYFDTANVSGQVKDVRMLNVYNPPPDPEGLINISQWINVTKNENDAWLSKIKFHFQFPNPEGIIPKIIYKFDGTYQNGSWTQQTWTALSPVYVDIANKYIFADINISNFSIFAPYGIQVNHTVPQPQPTPTPTPTPAGGGGGGGGGGGKPTGKEFEAAPPKLNLTISPENITLQQGQTGEISFNITNYGKLDAGNVLVVADVRKGWNASVGWFDLIRTGETKSGKLYIKVYDNEIPGDYYVPIRVVLNQTNNTVAVKLLKVTVIPRQKLARMEIVEIPPFLALPENSENEVAILVKNTGDFNLTNIKLEVHFGEKCIESVTGNYSLAVGEQKSLVYKIKTKPGLRKCKTIFTLKSKEGAVAFAPVVIELVPRKAIKGYVLPWLLLAWTIITLILFSRRIWERIRLTSIFKPRRKGL